MPWLSPHSPADVGRSSWFEGRQGLCGCVSEQEAFIPGALTPIKPFHRETKTGPTVSLYMSQHLAAGPSPSLHYFRRKNELQGLKKIKRQLARQMVALN